MVTNLPVTSSSCFYFAGIKIVDVLKIRRSDIYDGRLHYRMNKNDKLLSLKLPDRVNSILKYYKAKKRDTDDFIFPEMKKAGFDSPRGMLAKTKTATKKFNTYLADVMRKLKLIKRYHAYSSPYLWKYFGR